jgi:hypothetical protein
MSDSEIPDFEISSFGSEPGKGGFNELSKQYKAQPTIEHYVQLRQQHPDGEIEIATAGGIEFLFSQESELLSHGIKPRLFTGVLDANPVDHAEFSLVLLELIIKRNEEEKKGTHIVSRKKAISDTLVNYLIAEALDSLSWNDSMEISRELIVLIKHQLGCNTSHYEAEENKKKKITDAKFVAIQIMAQGKRPTYRQIGRVLGVQPSTVMRWFPDGTFMSEVADMAMLIKDSKLFEKKKADALGGLLVESGTPATAAPKPAAVSGS